MKSLLLTLGHNSSAILVENGNVLCGYEEERLSRIKGDSSFPIKSIKKIFEVENITIDNINSIYISHWFDNFDFYKNYSEKINKYYDYKIMHKYLSKIENIYFLNKNFTHHDAHLYSVKAFYENNGGRYKYPTHCIVADGFGNKQEVFSIYKIKNNKISLENRIYDYKNSLGLFYQYATAYVGMKENQDEYKFLGYESKIKEVLTNKKIRILSKYANSFAKKFFNNMISSNKNILNISDDFINLEYLKETKKYFYNFFDKVLDLTIDDVEKHNLQYEKRCIIGFFIQKTIEKILYCFIKRHKIKSLLVAGGIFYNVKLNNSIMKKIKELCIIPLAGDQGAAIGLYDFYNKNFHFGDLCYGKRIENDAYKNKLNTLFTKKERKQILFYSEKTDRNKIIEKITNLLDENKIPQIYRGKMEFGPRALCNTSTLCIPEQKNVSFVNKANDRNEIMPCAPIIKSKNINKFFNSKQTNKIIGSDKYMILTYDYKFKIKEEYSGVMHNYPLKNKYSGRPQIIYDKNSIISKVLSRVKHNILVNTSFNCHGRPIVYTIDNALDDYRFQLNNTDDKSRLYLIIIGE